MCVHLLVHGVCVTVYVCVISSFNKHLLFYNRKSAIFSPDKRDIERM